METTRISVGSLAEIDKKKIFNFTLDNAATGALHGIGLGVVLAVVFRRKSLLFFSTGYFIGKSFDLSNRYLLDHIQKEKQLV